MRKAFIALALILAMAASVGIVSAKATPYHVHDRTLRVHITADIPSRWVSHIKWTGSEWDRLTTGKVIFTSDRPNVVITRGYTGDCNTGGRGICVSKVIRDNHILLTYVVFDSRISHGTLWTPCLFGHHDAREASTYALGLAFGVEPLTYFYNRSPMAYKLQPSCNRELQPQDIRAFESVYRNHG